MSYKIAVVSGDGVHIDQSFGAAEEFAIYEVEETAYRLVERRQAPAPAPDAGAAEAAKPGGAVSGCADSGEGCGSARGGCGGGQGGCGGGGAMLPKVELIRDCRCVICKKVGFHIQKQLEKLAITSFDVDCTVEEALEKIVNYLDKIDNHRSLRGLQGKPAGQTG